MPPKFSPGRNRSPRRNCHNADWSLVKPAAARGLVPFAPEYRDAAIEKKGVLKARGYAWSPGEFGRPKCWYRDVADADRAAEVSWLRANVMESDQAVWVLRITAGDRYSDRCWSWGEQVIEAVTHTEDRSSLVSIERCGT